MPEIRWIYLSVSMFDDEKIQIIESMPDSDTILLIWIKLLTLAGKCNNQGYIFLSPDIPYTDETLSTIFKRPLLTVRLALDTFTRFNMISINDGIIHITNWDKWQSIEGMDRIRELQRDRVRRFREAKKQQQLLEEECNVTGNVTVTPKNKNKNKNKNKDIDIDIRKELQEKNIYSHSIFDYLDRKIWDEYIKMRIKIKAPLTDHAVTLQLNKLQELKLAGNDPNTVVNQSIMNSWKGLFPIKALPPGKKDQSSDRYSKGKYAHMVQH